LLGPHARLADRPRVAVLDLGLAAVLRRASGPAHPPAGARGTADRGRARRLLRPAAQVPAPARRPDRRAAARRRARPDPLVLPLPAVVLPVRGLRGAGPRRRPPESRPPRPR